MNHKIFSLAAVLIAAVFVAVSCAKVSAPVGGPRDKEPPVMVKSIPEFGALNFNGRRIEILFNEFVALDQISDKFMVSPPMKKKPLVYLRGKGIIVDFEEPLRSESTYTLYFQDAVRDLNEANILENFEFVFSTGNTLDSLAVTGNVYNAQTLEVPEKAIVLLHRNLSDTAVKKVIPDYISGIDANGYFRVSNISPGTYRLFALADEDNSRTYNLETEQFAFLDSLLTVTPEKNHKPVPPDTTTIKRAPGTKPELPVRTGDHMLLLFQAPKKAHYLAGSNRELKYKMNFILSLPPDTMKFNFSIPGADEKSYFIEESRERDSIRVWITDSTLYSQPQLTTLVSYPFTDSLGVLGYKQDTIPLRFAAPRPARSAKVKRTIFTYDTPIKTGDLRPGAKIFFSSTTPFRPPDTSRIRLYELVDSKRKNIRFSLNPDPDNSCRYNMSTSLVQGKQYLFIADSASFGNIYNEHSDSAGIKFTMRDPESYNKLSFDITGSGGSIIVQLLAQDEKIAGEVKLAKDGKALFTLLDAGKYKAKAIYDLNSDGKWTSGDFSKGRQPEAVSYYGQEIDLKPGWNADNAWDISLRNIKDQKLRKKKEGSR